MSEKLPGSPPPPPVAKPRDAAAVILYRQTGSGVEVFWLRRERNLSFAGGFYAFPGGRVDAQDAQLPVDGAAGIEGSLRAAAARELFEETGVLALRGAERLTPAKKAELRLSLLEKKLKFADLMSQHSLNLSAADFLEAGRWVTPPFSPARFDARFFLVECPPGQVASVDGREATEGSFVRPQEALSLWEKGLALLHPPNLHGLQVMAGFTTRESALEKLKVAPYAPNFIAQRIEFQKGIRLFPLETETLPPAAHTNAYVVGNGDLLIVDPGAAEVRQYARLLALIAGYKAEGKRPVAVFLTHHHGDHVSGAEAVKTRLQIPVWCHERTADRLPFKADRILKDGDKIVLGGVPAMSLTVLHTPGHARGHLCLVDDASKAAIVGDMVAGVGTILIDPPEGDMTDYLGQLRRLKELPVGVLYPAHGMAMPDGPAKLAEYISHREMREKKVVLAISPNGSTLHEIAKGAYAELADFAMPLAERSTQAILIKLVREGRVQRKDDRYALAPPKPA